MHRLTACCYSHYSGQVSHFMIPPLRYHGLKEQRDSKSHAAEMVEMRMKESTHHQQLAHLQELKDTIGEYMGGGLSMYRAVTSICVASV